jgi:uncharacterized protein with NAD-binding domain and iron-sulfur cluster
LHVWLGFYENAFRLMRECYAELGRDPNSCRSRPFAMLRAGFAHRHRRLVGRRRLAAWTALFPPVPGEPGLDFTRDNPYTVTGYVVRMLEVLRALLVAATQQPGPAADAPASSARKAGYAAALRPAGGVGRRLRGRLAARQTDAGQLSDVQAPLAALLQRLQATLVSERARLTAGADDARRVWEVMDLVLAIFRGLVQSGTFLDPRGLDALDEYDVRDWLRRYGRPSSHWPAASCAAFTTWRSPSKTATSRAPASPPDSAARRSALLLHLPRRAVLEDARRHG